MHRVFVSVNDQLITGLQQERVTFLSRVSCNSEWRYPLHVHVGQVEVIYMLKGVLNSSIGGTAYAFRQGDIVMIKPGIVHANVTDRENTADFFVLNFDQLVIEHFEQLFADNDFLSVNAGEHRSFLVSAMDELIRLLNNHDESYTPIVQSLLAAVIKLTKKLFATEPIQTYKVTQHAAAYNILYYITDHYNEPLTLNSLSKHFFMSQTHLSRLFASAFGVSPINFLIGYRIGKAQEIFGVNPEAPIATVALKTGFANVNHFTNTFIRRVGNTPSEYKAKYKAPLPPAPAENGSGG